MEALAIKGGPKAIPDGTYKPWPPIDDIDRRLVMEALEAPSHKPGPQIDALEKEFGEWAGLDYCLAVNSGTAALHMCVVACDCGAGDEVIAPAYTWSSSVTCALHHNAIPVFVDIDWDTMNIDVDKIEDAITERTKAIVIVHLHGLAVNMEKVMAIADRHGLKVIEDCCQAHGATCNGQKVGTFGHCAAFSFNDNKCLAACEGGAFVTNDEEMSVKAAKLRQFGEYTPPNQSRDFHAYALGWMYRTTEINAAFARAQLTKLDGYLKQQAINAARLAERLDGMPHLILPTVPDPACTHNWYNYTIRFDMDALGHADDAFDFRARLVEALKAEGVDTGLWQRYIVPEMAVFQARNAYGKGCPWDCPHAGPVNYDPAQFPVAKKHADWHTGMTFPLRSPNGPEAAEWTAKGFAKVMEHVDEI